MVDLQFLTEAMSATGIETFVIDEAGASQVAAPSPFLQGTKIQFAWDSTSLGWLKTCPRLYQYNMIEGWRANEENDNLRFGIEYHQALQDYDISRCAGIPHEDAVYDVVRAVFTRIADWRPTHKHKNRYYLIRTVVWYLDQYQNDPAKIYIRQDGRPAVEVSFRFGLPELALDGHEFLLCGHLDKIVEFNDCLFVMDHKTGVSSPGDYYFRQYDVNNQMTLYTLAGKIVLNAPISGVIINYAHVAAFTKTAKPEPFVRGITYRSDDQLEEWLGDLKHWFQRAAEYASDDYWPMNDTACHMYGGCRFRDICSKSPRVREKFLQSNYNRSDPWNPLKAR